MAGGQMVTVKASAQAGEGGVAATMDAFADELTVSACGGCVVIDAGPGLRIIIPLALLRLALPALGLALAAEAAAVG